MNTLETMKQALYELCNQRDAHYSGDYPTELREAITNLRAAISELEKAEPVAWLPSSEWTPCVKLPVTVHVRNQREGETHVSTREGITPVKPDDLIMRGVSGEEYPIGCEIFERTYRIGEATPRRDSNRDPALQLLRDLLDPEMYGHAVSQEVRTAAKRAKEGITK